MAIAVTDKREANLKSPNMELLGLKKYLKQLSNLGIEVEEVTTDAYPQIAAFFKGKARFFSSYHLAITGVDNL